MESGPDVQPFDVTGGNLLDQPVTLFWSDEFGENKYLKNGKIDSQQWGTKSTGNHDSIGYLEHDFSNNFPNFHGKTNPNLTCGNLGL